MLPRSVVLPALVLGALALSPRAGAQPAQPAQPAPASSPATGTTEVLPPAQGQQEGAAPAADGEKGEKKDRPVVPAAGYAYSDKPVRSASRGHYRTHGPVVNMPGFEQSPDGGSRLFVQLSQPVKVEERRAQGSVTYILKGASPRVWNNTNALVTVHFNTPVSSARLVPVGQDLHFVVELRAAVSPTWKVDESQDKTATLAIDFPKGDYLSAAPTETAAANSTAATSPKPARATKRGARHPKP